MKLIHILSIVSLIIMGCSKISADSNAEQTNTSEDYQTECMRSFAIIMSKAIYAEPELREFVKNEALKRTDLDYDVFYPWIKDEVVSEGRSFENILREYDANSELDRITEALPLLTILVPDWTWVNEECFGPHKWQTESPDVGVSYLSSDSSHEIFHNGEYAFSLTDMEYSTAPVLIVKNNERIAYSGMTKSGEIIYDFNPDDYIDTQSEINTKASYEYEIIDLEYETTNNIISAINLYGNTRAAYSKTNGTNVPQRDYIYYGMTSSITEGIVNKNYYERLYKIRISPTAKGVFDEPLGETGTDYTGIEVKREGKNNYLTESEILETAWGEGSIELTIKVYASNHPLEKKLSVSFGDAFDVKKIILEKKINWLGNVKAWTYYLKIPEDLDASEWLESKWINVNYELFYWDLSAYPIEYYIEFVETDSGTIKYRDVKHSHTFATNFTSSIEFPLDKVKIGWSYGSTDTVSKTFEYSESYTETDDKFGNFVVQYADKIVTSQTNSKATIRVYSTGYVDAMIIPIYK